MHSQLSRFWRVSLVFAMLAGLLIPTSYPAAAIPARQEQPSRLAAPNIIVDGVIEPGYGAPFATDAPGDTVNGTNLDLLELYIAQDATYYYFAFTINADINATNWGKYALYIDTNGVDNQGATSDAWGRDVIVNNPHRPEYGLYSWVDASPYGPTRSEFYQWGGSSWTKNGTIDQAAKTAGTPSVLEWAIAKSRLGNPQELWVEVWSTGGGTTDNAQDTLNDPAEDWNATDWSTQAVLDVTTQFPLRSAVVLTVTAPVDNFYSTNPFIDVIGTVSPTLGTTIVVDVDGTDYNPTVQPISGAFTQTVMLVQGVNTITIQAVHPTTTVSTVRRVHYLAVHDNEVVAAELAHDSRSTTYRTPGGAQPIETDVTLRLRAASGDLTGAKARVYNDRLNSQALLDMTRVADDGAHEWWEVTLPASADPTIYWYRFIAIDGTDTVYYEDQSIRDGGLGEAIAASIDASWQLTFYDPAFQTPDWVKNAVFYQIFPDRFRDGDPNNNLEAGTFFYDEPGGTIERSLDPEGDWNTPVCDPRAAGDCAGSYSKNFYGGDLKGLIDKLDYLESLGVTAIYLNPIFESPSNHKYDTTDYSLIDDNFGDLTTFISLTTELAAREMHLVLDGVFNHVSSDSIYFDRYGRYATVGACESQLSPYRDWFYFTDVEPGTGTCVGSDGSALAAEYTSWFGYDSLPKLQANSQEARDLIWADGVTSIGPYWIDAGASGWRLDVAGDVDPGTTNDPTNDYWEGFRSALHAVNPETYIVGEEWGNASAWTLGDEWDATMNYQYSSAMLSFWRDEPFDDNDHNSGSSAGILEPLMPSQLDARLHNWQERYAPEAYYAMMNLLGSHDTNRPLFMLDHNTDLISMTLYADPAYDWSDAIERLKGVTLLQFTLPGAPTIYYGDEVGLVGPVGYYGGKWEDDPYNRQPFPWLEDITDLPFYDFLKTTEGQDELRTYYQMMIATRNAHPALRTGSFDTLLIDDPWLVYAYGRKLDDGSDAAVIILNRHDVPHEITLDLAGYLPYGLILENVLDGNEPYTIDGSGELIITVPPMSGAVLVTDSNFDLAQAPVTDLAVTDEDDGSISLDWSTSPGASGYSLYRSLLSGGGYTWISDTLNTSYTDSGLVNGIQYHYVVVARNDTSGLNSGYSNQVTGIPHAAIDSASLESPAEIDHTIGIVPTEAIYGLIYIAGQTDDSSSEPAPGLLAQVGYGAAGTAPEGWTHWVNAVYNADVGNNDQFMAQLTPESTGEFEYVYRYSNTAGRDWEYAQLDGLIADPSVAASDPGVLHVNASPDGTPPTTPINLQVSDWDMDYIELTWDAVSGDATLYAYDLYRSTISGTVGIFAGRVLAPTTIFTDTSVATGITYYYNVQAVDTSFNRSGYSNQAYGTAVAKQVLVTFTVRVPEYSAGTVYIAGNFAPLPSWTPDATPMTEISPDVWSIDLLVSDGTQAQFKFTRGSWDTVEKWGTITGLANRSTPISYGTDGTQLVDCTATDWGTGEDDLKAVQDWEDPLVTATDPAAGAVSVDVHSAIKLTWNHAMKSDTTFTVTDGNGAVAGTFTYDITTFIVTFTPSPRLKPGTLYTVNASGQVDEDGTTQQVNKVITFETEEWYDVLLPLIFKVFAP